jgi:hypothetical protein
MSLAEKDPFDVVALGGIVSDDQDVSCHATFRNNYVPASKTR